MSQALSSVEPPALPVGWSRAKYEAAYEQAKADAKASGKQGRIWPDEKYAPVPQSSFDAALGALLLGRDCRHARSVRGFLSDPLVLAFAERSPEVAVQVQSCREWLTDIEEVERREGIGSQVDTRHPFIKGLAASQLSPPTPK